MTKIGITKYAHAQQDKTCKIEEMFGWVALDLFHGNNRSTSAIVFDELIKVYYDRAMLCGTNRNRRNLTTVCIHLPYKGGVGK